MNTMTRRGAVAALFALGLAPALGAQVAAGGFQIRREPRDSVEIRAIAMTRARLDSVATLMRELNRIPPNTPESEAMRVRIDALMATMPGRVVIRSTAPTTSPAFPKGWIGINAQGPKNTFISADGYFVQYFDYPLIISVDPDSPAQRAGIVPGDVLLGYDGADVKGRRIDLTQLLVPDKKLTVSVRHDGESKDFTVTVAPAPTLVADRRAAGQAEIFVERVITSSEPRLVMAPSRAGGARGAGGTGGASTARVGMVTPFRYFFTANGAFGAILQTVNPELAKTLKLDTGVLVVDITDETPASRSGLKTGDVIVAAAGQAVASLKALQEVVAARMPDRSVVLQVMRDKRPQKVTLSW